MNSFNLANENVHAGSPAGVSGTFVAGGDVQNTASLRTNQPTRAARKIKKIWPGLRRRRAVDLPPIWYDRFLWRLKNDSQFLRSTVQISFLLLCIWIGIEFHLFARWGMSSGEEPFVSRPPGVGGFLPIGALISAKYWLQTGIINTVPSFRTIHSRCHYRPCPLLKESILRLAMPDRNHQRIPLVSRQEDFGEESDSTPMA